MLGIDRATDSPNRAGFSLDPDHDTFSDTRIIDPFEHALGEDRARLEPLTDFLLPSLLQSDGSDGDVPGGESVRLEDDDVVGRLTALELAGNNLLQLVHLEPIEDAGLHRLDQIARFDPRLLARVAADERGSLEDDGL